MWAGEQKTGEPSTSGESYSAGLVVGWEIDFWGKFRRGIESADAAYLASIAQYDDIHVLLAAQVASLYVTIRTLELRLRIAQENTELQRRSLEITESLFRSGNESELDVQQAKSLYLSTLATLPELETALRQTQNALSILLARPPGPLPEMEAGHEQDSGRNACNDRRHARGSAAPPSRCARGGDATGRAIGVDRGEPCGVVSVDRAGGFSGAVVHVSRLVHANAQLGRSARRCSGTSSTTVA